ncbi:MAG: UDP-N-acetylglucosamine 2-epimerase [Candidatus Omnitrophica bacterium]|nr:UDP-N-acetylglucosamine 2-epimerase [Candidatus Omnitrophota bacterium]
MKILIIHATAGAGHLKAAQALHQAFLANGKESDEIKKIDALDYTNDFFKKAYPAVYIFLIRYAPFLWGWIFHMLNCRWLKPLINSIRHFFNAVHSKRLISYVLNEQPEAVICEHFLSAELMAHLKRKGRFKGYVFCGITDFGVHQFWINEGTDFYFVASEMTKDELICKGVPQEKVIITGIPVDEKFSKEISKTQMRLKLGLDEGKFTVLITSGGFGVGPIKKIAGLLDEIPSDLQMLVICGKNPQLLDFFKKQTFKKKIKAFGYVNNMEECMEASDIIISKSGGLTVSESLVKGLPMLIIRPIPGQEMRNAQIIEDYKIGIRMKDVSEVTDQVEKMLEGDGKVLKEMKENALKLAKPKAAQRICAWVTEKLLLIS